MGVRSLRFPFGGFFLAMVGAVGVSGGMFFTPAVLVEAFGFFPGMAFTGDTEEGKGGEEQGGSFHNRGNLAEISVFSIFIFQNPVSCKRHEPD